ncbi:MAG: bifunctional UDP-N-acetylglucosamine diphosphorylase/glucosamine-1-phosphate N-acetyltransferase GlmU [Hyphomicrobiales bacterium]|nr:bifunctional UDP-N-acetylglucosamine diphosphorylase/glucosamine-1-phosphate N-acetyltransferase GlmU [Hyphomicrobiales bacterium]
MSNSQNRSCIALVLAAGEGTRMKSGIPKVLHKVAGLEMVNHVVKVVGDAQVDLCAVVSGNQSELVESAIINFNKEAVFFPQLKRLGTANAVLAAQSALEQGFDDVLVLFGDAPLLRPQTLVQMRQCLADGADVAVLGFHADDPYGYGRLVEKDGKLIAIREHKEASEEELAIQFCNGGIMAINGAKCLELVKSVSNNNSKGEYYLTDVVEIANERGLNVVAHKGDEQEILGINNRVELAEAEQIWQERRRRELMLDGVSMVAPQTVFLSYDTIIGSETTLEPCQVFGPGVQIGSGVKIRAYCHFEQSIVDNDCDIGPYARLRPGTEISQSGKVGNFVEIKNAKIETGAKVNHLSYIGDAEVGERVNIGAGTITCNYDGVNKHLTQIGAGAFIGSNSALVAPVSIGENAYVGSGSVVTKNAPADSLVVSRARQTTMEGRAVVLKNRALAFKKAKAQKPPES